MNPNFIDYYQKQIDDINSLKKNRSEKLIDLVKHITTIALGMLTILITFKKEIQFDMLFSLVIIFVGLTVVCGVFYVYHVIHELNKLIRFQDECLIKRINGNVTELFQFRYSTKWYYTVSKFIFLYQLFYP